MTHIELWPAVLELPRVEKLRLLERLANDLAHEEQAATIPVDVSIPFWSPYDSYEAAAALMAALEKERLPRP